MLASTVLQTHPTPRKVFTGYALGGAAFVLFLVCCEYVLHRVNDPSSLPTSGLRFVSWVARRSLRKPFAPVLVVVHVVGHWVNRVGAFHAGTPDVGTTLGGVLWEQDQPPVSEDRPRDVFVDLEDRISLHSVPYKRAIVLGSPFIVLGLWVAGRIVSRRPVLVAEGLPVGEIVAVFMGLSVIFFRTIFVFDDRLFDMITDIRPAFEASDEEFYAFFGRMAKRLYEPLPTSPAPDDQYVVVHPPTATLMTAAAALIFYGNARANPGSPVHKPVLLYAYNVFLTFLGLFAIVIFLWVTSVMFVYMSYKVREMDVTIDPARTHNNLGLRPYGQFVLTITGYILLTLALGGFALVTSFSQFILGLFVLNLIGIPFWFVSTQYGLHRSIVEAKQDFAVSTAGDASLEAAESGFAISESVDRITEWPVNVSTFIEVAIYAIASTGPAVAARVVPELL